MSTADRLLVAVSARYRGNGGGGRDPDICTFYATANALIFTGAVTWDVQDRFMPSFRGEALLGVSACRRGYAASVDRGPDWIIGRLRDIWGRVSL